MSIAMAGQAAAALRTLAACSDGGVAMSRSTTPSSSGWATTSPALSTHWPDDTHFCWSRGTVRSWHLRYRCLPYADDSVDQPGGHRRPTRPGHPVAVGEGPFEV